MFHEVMHCLRHASCWKHAFGVMHLEAAQHDDNCGVAPEARRIEWAGS
jgi:hypothetical protein